MPAAQGASIQAANNRQVEAAAAGLPQLGHPLALDPVVLADLTGGDAAETVALLDDFLASTGDDLAQLEHLRGAGDLHGLTRQAHKIKGAARLVGAVELADAASMLESAGRSGDWGSVLPLAVDVATAVERLRLDVAARYRA
ncbi:MAG: Hpt domain-containing protein [Lysobacteraceae bacterium]|nr:MAG: Hpt domain-containing protein [Xanthomonadaceae bacterium]